MSEPAMSAEEDRWIDNALALIRHWADIRREAQIREILTDLYMAGRKQGRQASCG